MTLGVRPTPHVAFNDSDGEGAFGKLGQMLFFGTDTVGNAVRGGQRDGYVKERYILDRSVTIWRFKMKVDNLLFSVCLFAAVSVSCGNRYDSRKTAVHEPVPGLDSETASTHKDQNPPQESGAAPPTDTATIKQSSITEETHSVDAEATGADKKTASSDETPPVPLHVWKKGDKLSYVVHERYEIPKNRDWTDSFRVEPVEDLILYYNGLKSSKKIREGTEIRLPPRDQIFIEAGFPAELREHLQDLLLVESLYFKHCYEALDYMCDDDKPAAKRVVPPSMKKDFNLMSEKTAAFKKALEERKGPSVSRKLKKVLSSLQGLQYTFESIVNWKYDANFCDFGAKDVTGTKRIFSNLVYQLYKWSLEEKALLNGQ
jgi:hypothetical protein